MSQRAHSQLEDVAKTAAPPSFPPPLGRPVRSAATNSATEAVGNGNGPPTAKAQPRSISPPPLTSRQIFQRRSPQLPSLESHAPSPPASRRAAAAAAGADAATRRQSPRHHNSSSGAPAGRRLSGNGNGSTAPLSTEVVLSPLKRAPPAALKPLSAVSSSNYPSANSGVVQRNSGSLLVSAELPPLKSSGGPALSTPSPAVGKARTALPAPSSKTQEQRQTPARQDVSEFGKDIMPMDDFAVHMLSPMDSSTPSVSHGEFPEVTGDFDIESDSTDEDDADSLPITLSSTHQPHIPSPSRQEVTHRQHPQAPPPPQEATSSPTGSGASPSPTVKRKKFTRHATALPSSLGEENGELHDLPHTGTESLESLTENGDDTLLVSTPRTDLNDRLDTATPNFMGFATVTSSRPGTGSAMGAPRTGRLGHLSSDGLAVFVNQPRECALCHAATVAFVCEVCDHFFLCEDCRFDVKALHAAHDPTHAMLSLQDQHCGSSRTFGGDSIFSLSGENGGASSLFNPPCSRCERVIDDLEPVYRCEQCDYVVCQECYFKPREVDVVVDDSPHEHVLKRFQRKAKTGPVHEGAVVTKSRNSDGHRIINDYVVVQLLGQGSYAKVKLVQHIRTQELFALKILKKQRKNSVSTVNLGRSRAKMASAGVSEDELLREIAVMKLIDHPNVIKLKEVIEDVEACKVYVIMEYCENGPVHTLGKPSLPTEQVRQYAADILRGLLHLHSEYLFHRDVKPANCLVNRDFVAKIADFGTCNSHMRTKTSDGTLAFSCPEQTRGEEVSGEVVDSWAFALTLYQMAYGTLPVSTTSLLQHRNMLLGSDPIPIPPHEDPQLCDLLTCMLEKNTFRRMRLSAAAQHPFFADFHIDSRGAPYTFSQLVSVKSQSQQHPAPLSFASLHDGSGSAEAALSEVKELRALNALYDKALETVHRGKNLKDHFHGVRALRRVRRKEAESARHDDLDDAGSSSDAAQAADIDVAQNNGLRHHLESSEDVESGDDVAPRSPTNYGYGGSDTSSLHGITGEEGEGREEEHKQQQQKDAHAPDDADAATAVDETVEHHLASKESRLEVNYIPLSSRDNLDKLNRLATTVMELRLSHNSLITIAPLRMNIFTLLKEVAITFNKLEVFPEEVLAAPRLIRLDLSHNRICFIPECMVIKAPFLERLSLHHNFISVVGTTTVNDNDTDVASFPTGGRANVINSLNAPSGNTRIAQRGKPRGRVVSVLAGQCLRHVRLSGNPLESLPEALETTRRLELVLDAIPALMAQWKSYAQGGAARIRSIPLTGTTPSSGTSAANTLPAVIVWDDSFPVRIPDVPAAVWLAVNNMAAYRVQTLRTCLTRRVVLCQCEDSRFPNGAFSSEDLASYFEELAAVMQEHQQQQQLHMHVKGDGGEGGSYPVSASGTGSAGLDVASMENEALPPVVGRAARSYVESYFFATDDDHEENGGYESLVEYLMTAFAAREAVLVVMMRTGSSSMVRRMIVAALSTCLAQLKDTDTDDVSAQAELVVNTMRSLYA